MKPNESNLESLFVIESAESKKKTNPKHPSNHFLTAYPVLRVRLQPETVRISQG